MAIKEEIHEALNRYAREANGALVNEQPSRLNRGEGTEVDYFLLKVDLVSSTLQLQRQTPRAYLKFAHTFLSTLDQLTGDYGAQQDQTEYAGDSVLAYFPTTEDMGLRVLSCAGACRYAVDQMSTLDRAFAQIKFRTRIVMHHGRLIVGNIGPWGNRLKKVMGIPIHSVAHIEKSVNPLVGYATTAFADQLPRIAVRTYLSPQMRTVYDPPSPLAGILGSYVPPAVPRQVTEHYLVSWRKIYLDMGFLAQ